MSRHEVISTSYEIERPEDAATLALLRVIAHRQGLSMSAALRAVIAAGLGQGNQVSGYVAGYHHGVERGRAVVAGVVLQLLPGLHQQIDEGIRRVARELTIPSPP